jgi:hypothetical protein
MFDLKNLNDDYFATVNPEEVLEIKELPAEDKVTCFRYFLTSDVISNISVISNIFLLIDGVSSISDDTLQDNRVFFKSLEEYVDIKLQLRNEIDSFNIKLVEYYLGIIEGIDVVLDELKTHITNTHYNLMNLVTPSLISKLMLKYLNRISLDNVKPVFHAVDLYNKINNTDNLIVGFLQKLTNEVNTNAVNNR